MQMRSRKQRQPGRRSRSRRSLKGGAPKAYNYEGVDLSVGNPLIQIAVTQEGEDNGTYNFNVPGASGASFNNYCDIVRYYEQNVPLACVKPSFVNSTGKTMVVPSLVQILGLALLLQNAKVRLQLITPLTHAQISSCIVALFGIANSPDSSLFTASQSGCIVSQPFKTKAANALEEYDFFKVSNLSKDDVDSILLFFKRAIFYFKFNALPTQHLELLTFNAILFDDPKPMATFIVDPTPFNTATTSDPFKLYKKVFYTKQNLSDNASAASVAAPVAPSAASAASLAPSPSSSVDARLAALETAVAGIQQSVAAIQRKLA